MTITRFDSIDYSALPVPDAINTFTHQSILDARIADFLARWKAAQIIDPTLPDYDVSSLETDPGVILQEADAYRELIVRQRINDAVRATYLASAVNNDLTDRAAEYMTARATGETDASLRKRAQLAWENLSIGGSYGGYAYQALSVAPVEIADVSVWGYEAHETSLFGAKAIADFPKGEVRIGLLGSNKTGFVAPGIISATQAALSDRTRRKVNDKINVVQATVVSYTVDAKIILKRGVSDATAADIVTAARTRIAAYAAAVRVQGVRATRGGFEAALMAAEPGLVTDCELYTPTASVGGGPFEAPVLSGVSVDWALAS